MTSAMSTLTEHLAGVIGPLDDVEERAAVEAAMAHLNPGRPVVYGVELRIEKRRRGVPGREVAVLLADLDPYRVHEVVIRDGEVVGAIEQSGLVPPFTDDEVAEATVLARSHLELAEAARLWGVRPAAFYPSAHGHQEGGSMGGRRVGIHFLDLSDPAAVTPVVSVVVNLTVAGVESVQRYPGNRSGE